MTENLDNLALNFLDSGSVNWRLGIKLYNSLVPYNPLLAKECLKRSIELKPTLIKRINIQDDDLKKIANRHLQIALDHNISIGSYYGVPTINSIADLDLQIFQVISTEVGRYSIDKINSKDKVFGFGSCFAVNFINYLSKLGINAQSSIIAEDINSPINNLSLLKWVFHNEDSLLIQDLRGLNQDIDRLALLQNFQDSSHIVLTLGSAFYLTKNSEATLKPTKNTKYCLQSHSSIKQNISSIIHLIKSFNNNVNLIITVSPIPLRGVLDSRDPISANIASKASLRSALEELLIEKKVSFTYLPIYDVILGLSPYMNMATFGTDDGESRHLNGFVINSVMKQFSHLIIDNSPK